MKNAGFTTLAKLLAICFSISLLGGYVWWRQDQAKKREAQRTAAIEAALKRAKEQQIEEGQDPSVIIHHEFLSGSKSGMVMPSTKSGGVFGGTPRQSIDDLLLPVEPEPDKDNEDPAEKERILMPSSKSIDRILIPREQEPEPQK